METISHYEGSQSSESSPESKVQILRQRLSVFYKKKGARAAYEYVTIFARTLQERYPQCREYRLYHLLIGSTPMGECNYFDFDNEDSIEKFINTLV